MYSVQLEISAVPNFGLVKDYLHIQYTTFPRGAFPSMILRPGIIRTVQYIFGKVCLLQTLYVGGSN